MVQEEVLPRPLGPYVLLARVGRGGMGDVYLAKHGMLLGFEKHCVLKMLRDDRADDDQLLARFADEARVVVQLSHRNICPVFDVGRVGSRLYVALEYVVGRDLRTVASAGPVPTAIALHIVGEVLEALDYAHRFVDVKSGAPLGIVHRDVSPHNVLLGVDGDTKLIDFGIATTRANTTDSDGEAVLGKLSYMSPEHARGEVVDGRSDQFAAAIMLAELLLGERFFDGLTQQQVWEIVGGGTHRPARWHSLDPALRTILDRALSPVATDRFSTCADFGEALAAWARDTGNVAAPRDVRRHLRALFGDLAAENRALLRTVDITLEQLQARADAAAGAPAVLGPGQIVDDDEGQFESIATTLALPSHTPAFGSIPTTMLVDRSRRAMATPPSSSATAPLPELSAPSAAKGPRPLAFAVAGLAAGALLTLLAVVALRPGAPAPVDPTIDPALEVDPSSVALAPTPVPSALPDAGVVPVAAPVAVQVAVAVDGAGRDAGTEPDDVEVVEAGTGPATGGTPRPRPATARPTPRPAPSPTPTAPGLDAGTRADLASLAGCVEKVPCARGILEWSRNRGLSQNEQSQLKESASDCAKRCRLK
jgi:tRNA A-37 threonylcarbamoyl transferase component Bud32